MDILIHTLSGTAVGTVVAPIIAKNNKETYLFILISAFCGAFPDIDAISAWSGFDQTFGKWFSLENSGREIYRSKFWYSHHAFTHSLFASILFALLFSMRSWILKKRQRALGIFILCLLSYNAHLIGDLPTPGGSWGGINYFWPMETYSGGSGHIWWWNNYDIFLILLIICLVNFIWILVQKRITWTQKRKFNSLIFGTGLILILFQVHSRGMNFNNYNRGNYRSFESQSKEIQKEILGEKIYNKMKKFDDSMNLMF